MSQLSNAPEPLTPPDCDLRDFRFMAVNVVAIRDSACAAADRAEVFRSNFLLRCASWHQVPAASVPNDDRALATLAGFGRVVREWQKVREEVLQEWVLCSDDRYYHPEQAEKAISAWTAKNAQRARTEAARKAALAKRQNQGSSRPPMGSVTETVTAATERVTDDVTDSIGRVKGEGDSTNPIPGANAPLSPAAPATVPANQLQLVHQPQIQPLTTIPPCPVKQLVERFIATCPTLPRPRIEMWQDSTGAQAMRQRWKWLLAPDTVREDGSRYATTAAQAIAWFTWFFESVAASDFLTGRSGGWGKCDLAWLMKRENFMKVVQGNYDNKPATPSRTAA